MSTMKKPRIRHVFLTYAETDSAAADKLSRLLDARADVQVFTPNSLSVGENWQTRLRHALERSDVFILLVSPDSLASPWVLHQLGAAWSLAIPIIPVLADRSIGPKLPPPVTVEPDRFVMLDDLRTPGDLDVYLSVEDEEAIACGK